MQGRPAGASESSLRSYPKGDPSLVCTKAPRRRGQFCLLPRARTCASAGPSCPPGYEPLAPLPPPAASVPVWQDRTIASSRLRLLEYSAFMEVQRDPDTVMCLGVGVRVRATVDRDPGVVVQSHSSGSWDWEVTEQLCPCAAR